MHLLIAPDSFKESLAAAAVAEAMAEGARATGIAGLSVDICPVADGGEGTVDALAAAMGGVIRTTTVTGPLGEPVDARWAHLAESRTAVIEMAEAAGLHLVPEAQRDPTHTTTFGVGELIRAALDADCLRIIVGLGGSGTTDGGAGMAQALGVRFLDQAGQPIPDGLSGGQLRNIARVDSAHRDRRLDDAEIIVACDVTNPLTGANGAAAVYGPQKGATAEQVASLDAGLAHLAALCAVDPNQPGFGAAGGLGFGLVAFGGATLRPGLAMVLEVVGFDRRLAAADVVLTGEGRLDASSRHGKAAWGVAERARAAGKPVIAIVGRNDLPIERGGDADSAGPFDSVYALVDLAGDEASARREAPGWIARAATEAVRRIG